jgi:multidrug efflux pump subunit AcrB
MQFAFIRKGLKRDSSKPRRRTFLEIIQQCYNKLITACFAHPFITLGVGVASIVVGAVLFSMQPQKLMPRAERNQFAVEIYLPTGTSIERTSQVADSLAHHDEERPPRAQHHHILWLQFAALPDQLCPADGRHQLCAVHREHGRRQSDGGAAG